MLESCKGIQNQFTLGHSGEVWAQRSAQKGQSLVPMGAFTCFLGIRDQGREAKCFAFKRERERFLQEPPKSAKGGGEKLCTRANLAGKESGQKKTPTVKVGVSQCVVG